ncbi:unnamed protein product, partial [Medioppia subpectinata]
TDTAYTDKRYRVGPKPDFDRSEWTNEKATLGLPFPNLPYYIDGDIKITQSLAVLRHLARKNHLMGESADEELRISLAEQQLKDNNGAFTKICYNPLFEQLKADYLKQLPQTLDLLSKFLAERPYFAGERLTYVDFLAYEYLDQQKLFAPQLVSQYKN